MNQDQIKNHLQNYIAIHNACNENKNDASLKLQLQKLREEIIEIMTKNELHYLQVGVNDYIIVEYKPKLVSLNSKDALKTLYRRWMLETHSRKVHQQELCAFAEFGDNLRKYLGIQLHGEPKGNLKHTNKRPLDAC